MPEGRAGSSRHGSTWHLDRVPFDEPPGWKVVVPGWTQISWNQPQRGLVILVSFVTGTMAWFWTWGTLLSYGLLAYVFVTHITSIIDVLRQSSFPAYRRRRALILISGALATAFYIPLVCLFWATAWPGLSASTGSGYLVNCWAYRHGRPSPGDWVWLRMPPSGIPHGAEVVAVSGQEVEWTGRKWRVDGRDWAWHSTLRSSAWPQACHFQVPKDQILIEPETDGDSDALAGPLVLVSTDRVIGRAWARYYPVWNRQLL